MRRHTQLTMLGIACWLVLGGIANLNRLPSAIFIVDIHHEHIAVPLQPHVLEKTGFVEFPDDIAGDPTVTDLRDGAQPVCKRRLASVRIGIAVGAQFDGRSSRDLEGALVKNG